MENGGEMVGDFFLQQNIKQKHLAADFFQKYKNSRKNLRLPDNNQRHFNRGGGVDCVVNRKERTSRKTQLDQKI